MGHRARALSKRRSPVRRSAGRCSFASAGRHLPWPRVPGAVALLGQHAVAARADRDTNGARLHGHGHGLRARQGCADHRLLVACLSACVPPSASPPEDPPWNHAMTRSDLLVFRSPAGHLHLQELAFDLKRDGSARVLSRTNLSPMKARHHPRRHRSCQQPVGRTGPLQAQVFLRVRGPSRWLCRSSPCSFP